MAKRLFTLLLVALSLSLLSWTAVAENRDPQSQNAPLSIAYMHGWMTTNNIGNILIADHVHFANGNLDAVELSYELSPHNILRRILYYFVSTIEVAGLGAHRSDPRGSIYEADVYLIARWKHFPWDRYLVNTLAFGDGLSYVTKPPFREVYDARHNNHAKNLLNYLMVEATFALPSHPEIELLGRVHHRCGAWGFFGAGNLSSNVVAVGLRYHF
ncbi:hypothetical protein BH10PSE19_BH10PSE19_16070 [soil metagenome]